MPNDNSKSPTCNPRQIRPRNAMAIPGTYTPISPNDNVIPPNCNQIPRNDNRIPPNDNVIPHNRKDFTVISCSTAHKARDSKAKSRFNMPRMIIRYFYKPLNYRRFQRPTFSCTSETLEFRQKTLETGSPKKKCTASYPLVFENFSLLSLRRNFHRVFHRLRIPDAHRCAGETESRGI